MIKYKHKDRFGITTIVKVEGRLFVTKDKDGKDVFEGDKIYVFNNKVSCTVIWSATHRGWAVQLSENPKGLPMSFISFYPRDIELIESKENE